MRFKNLYHTFSESFIIRKSPDQTLALIESNFNLKDVVSIIERLTVKPDNYRQEFIREFDKKIQERDFEPLDINDQSATKLLNLFSEVASEISLTEYHEKLIESKFLEGNFRLLLCKNKDNFEIYHQIFGIYHMVNTFRLYKAEGIRNSVRFVLPTIESRISFTSRINGDINDLDVMITPIFTIWNLYKSSGSWPQETLATISFVTVFKKQFLELSTINDLMNGLENNPFKKAHTNIKLSSDYLELDLKVGNEATYDKLVEKFCSSLSKILGVTDQNIKRMDNIMHTGNVGPIFRDDGTRISIPDLDCIDSINNEDVSELLQAIQSLTISVRDEIHSKVELDCMISSARRMKVTWAVDFLNLYSKRARRLLGLASFEDNFPFRSYFRVFLSNLTRAENISAQKMILKNLNTLMIQNSDPSILLSMIKSETNKLDILFNLDTTEDFLYDDIKKLQNMTGINEAFDHVSWKTEFSSSLLFDEVQIKYSRNQTITNILLVLLSAVLIVFTLFSLKII